MASCIVVDHYNEFAILSSLKGYHTVCVKIYGKLPLEKTFRVGKN